MNTKRKTIGRTFSQSPLNSVPDSNEHHFRQTFTLASGQKAVFVLKQIEADDVDGKTFVIQERNGRDQSALTPESLNDICKSLPLQQFFPAIGIQHGDRIEILDGSRRRAAALLCHCGLNVLVTQASISPEDARTLAQDIQTAKEHNLREVGLQLLKLRDSGLSQKEIAEQRGLSQAKVTRAIQAASVSQELVSLFPVQSELSYADYKSLLAVSESVVAQGKTVADLIQLVADDISDVGADQLLSSEENKDQIIRIVRKQSQSMIAPVSKDKAIVSQLWSFDDKDRYARKKVKGRTFTYEFNRLSRELQDELDSVIAGVLNKHLS